MTQEIPFDKILEALEKPGMGENIKTVTAAMDEAEKVLNAVERGVSILERTGALPTIIRGMAKKLGVDSDTPLATGNSVSAPSEAHKQIMQGIASMDTKTLAEFARHLMTVQQAGQDANKPK